MIKNYNSSDEFIPILTAEQGYFILGSDRPVKIGLTACFIPYPKQPYRIVKDATYLEARSQQLRAKELGCTDPYLDRFIVFEYFYKAVTD